MATEHSMFISYRKVDGEDLATWIFEKFSGRGICVNSNPVIMTTQIDLAFPGGADWRNYLFLELEKAASLIIICSPATLRKYIDREDFFYKEIEWWIENRIHRPPILIAFKHHGNSYVPTIILKAWKNLQVTEIDSIHLSSPDSKKSKRFVDIFLESITRGSISTINLSAEVKEKMDANSRNDNMDGVCTWEKDRGGRYVYVNDRYAEAAGQVSPISMIGKTDYKMPWRFLADKFREGDRIVMYGDERSRIGVFEKEIMADKLADILVVENVIRDHSGRPIGVKGCFMDVTDGLSEFQAKKFRRDETGLYLGEEYNNLHIDTIEVQVLEFLIKTTSKNKIAQILKKNRSDIRGIIHSLIKKFQSSNEEDLLSTVIRSGIPFHLLNTP